MSGSLSTPEETVYLAIELGEGHMTAIGGLDAAAEIVLDGASLDEALGIGDHAEESWDAAPEVVARAWTYMREVVRERIEELRRWLREAVQAQAEDLGLPYHEALARTVAGDALDVAEALDVKPTLAGLLLDDAVR